MIIGHGCLSFFRISLFVQEHIRTSQVYFIVWIIGEEPIEILAELCAINSFDIDLQNPSVSE